MPALLLPTSAAPAALAAAPEPRTPAGNAAPAADFGAALGEAIWVAETPVLARGAFVAPLVAKDGAATKGGRGGIVTRDDAKAKGKGEPAAALPQTVQPAAGSPVPPAPLAPARLSPPAERTGVKIEAEGVSASGRTAQDPGPPTSPLLPAEGSAVSLDAAAGPVAPPHAASPAPDLAAGKPVAFAVQDKAVQQPASAWATTTGNALPDIGADNGADNSTENEAVPSIAAASPASLKPRATAPGDVGLETHGAKPAADPAATAELPLPARAAAGGGDPQPAPGTIAAAAGPAPLTSGPQPHAAAAPPAPASPAPPAAQLGLAVAGLHVGAGSTGHVSIRLDPEALGGVRVDVRRGEDGAAAVTLTVERAQTLHALQADLSHLHQALDRAGVPVEQRSVSLHLAAPEVQAGARDAAGGGGGRSGQHGEPQQRAPSPTRFAPGGEPAGWPPGLPGTPPGLLRAGFDITA